MSRTGGVSFLADSMGTQSIPAGASIGSGFEIWERAGEDIGDADFLKSRCSEGRFCRCLWDQVDDGSMAFSSDLFNGGNDNSVSDLRGEMGL